MIYKKIITDIQKKNSQLIHKKHPTDKKNYATDLRKQIIALIYKKKTHHADLRKKIIPLIYKKSYPTNLQKKILSH